MEGGLERSHLTHPVLLENLKFTYSKYLKVTKHFKKYSI